MTDWLLELVGPLCGTFGSQFGLNPSLIFLRVSGVFLVYLSSATQSFESHLRVELNMPAVVVFTLPMSRLSTAHFSGTGACAPYASSGLVCVDPQPNGDTPEHTEVSIQFDGRSIDFAYAVRFQSGAIIAGSIHQDAFFIRAAD
ncbi:MAG: hypothetical protein ACOZQL_15600 [Myxococcota bacterium]